MSFTIIPHNCKKFIESGKNYSIARHSVNLGRACQLSFNFQHMNIKRCVIHLMRKSGDGRIIVNGHLYMLPFNRTYSIEIKDRKTISIKREISHTGDISLISINLDFGQNPPMIINEPWESFIQNIHSMNGITATDDGVFASDGAKINHGSYISILETFPNDSFIKNDSIITFTKPCRIVRINSSDNYELNETIIPEEKQIESNFAHIHNTININNYGNSIAMNSNSSFIYDLKELDINSNYIIKIICESNVFSSPIKATIFSCDKAFDSTIIQTNNSKQIHKFSFKTSDKCNPFKLMFFKKSNSPADSTTIHSIECIKESDIVEKVEEMKENNFFKLSDYSSPNLNENIKNLFQKYSVLTIPTIDQPKLELNASIEFNDYDTKLWFYRMSNLFTNLNYKSKTYQFHNKEKVNEASIFIGDTLSHTTCNKILYTNVSSVIPLDNINKTILTTSLSDMFKLKPHVKNVGIAYLPWFYIHDNYTRKDYSIYFEEKESFTKQLISSWPQNKELIIVGSNVNTTDNMKSLNKYTDYKTLFKYIIEASNIIELSDNTHHKSGLIELGLHFGSNIITNNKCYIQSCNFLPTDNDVIDTSFIQLKTIDSINDYNSYNELNLEYLKGIIC